MASVGVLEPVLRCKSSSPKAALRAPVGFKLRPGLGWAGGGMQGNYL